MYSNKQFRRLYVYMFQYIYENSGGLKPEVLDTYLECPRMDTLDSVFSSVVRFICDWYKPKRNVFIYDADYDTAISEMLHNNSLQYFRDTYADNPDKLYNELITGISFKSPDADFTKKAVRTYVGVLCGMSDYLSRFGSADELYAYLDSYDTTDKKISLVHEVQNASHCSGYSGEGWGFRLAANWLKDIGMQDYCKPDTHVTRFVKDLGLTDRKTDKAVFCAFVDMIEQVKQTDPTATAFIADRLVYLIGSGDFYSSSISYKGNMDDFINKAHTVLSRE